MLTVKKMIITRPPIASFCATSILISKSCQTTNGFLKLSKWNEDFALNPWGLNEIYRLASDGWLVKLIVNSIKTNTNIHKFHRVVEAFSIPSLGTIFVENVGEVISKLDAIKKSESILHYDSDINVLMRLPSGVTGIEVGH